MEKVVDLAQRKNTLGGILLVSGCCIGAGMLGMPIVAATAGFIPSSVSMIICCAFMICTGLLILEANLWFAHEANMSSMLESTLGKAGKLIYGVVFIGLLYCLLVAYLSGAGELFSLFLSSALHIPIPVWMGGMVCMGLTGYLIYLGTGVIDQVNKLLMIGLALSYVSIIAWGAFYVQPSALLYQKWSASLLSMPLMLIAFGFHNLIPSLRTYLGGDRQGLCLAIIVGSLAPLAVYLVWQGVVLGMLPYADSAQLDAAIGNSEMVTTMIQTVLGSSMVLILVNYFAFFAIVTSYLGNALSCVDFLADALHLKQTKVVRALLCALVLLPPYIISVINPHLFLKALGYAGGFATVILFGILPALMVWVGRYRMSKKSSVLVPGGKPMLLGVIAFSLAIIALELNLQMGWF